MKKLIIALVAIASAVVANAAQAKWTANNLYQPGSTTAKGANYTGYFVETASLALADAQAYLATGDLDSVLGSITAGSEVKFNASGVVSTQAAQFGDYSNGATVSGYLLIVDSTNMDKSSAGYVEPTYAYLSAVTSGTTGAEGQTAAISFGKLNGTNTAAPLNPDSRVAGNWYAVPEPTSGLLMLLGMAGLALRRRRA